MQRVVGASHRALGTALHSWPQAPSLHHTVPERRVEGGYKYTYQCTFLKDVTKPCISTFLSHFNSPKPLGPSGSPKTLICVSSTWPHSLMSSHVPPSPVLTLYTVESRSVYKSGETRFYYGDKSNIHMHTNPWFYWFSQNESSLLT